MTRQPVSSSQITSIGHDPVKREMDIEFKSFAKRGSKPKRPSVYRYSNVGQEDYAALVNTESIGKHFGAIIKSNPAKFPFRRLEAQEAA